MTKKVLVVDDERDIVDLLAYNLAKAGYQVLTARNGREALQKAAGSPDLILLDVMMPEMDGLETLRALRQEKATRHIPVIFLTAKGMEMDEVVGLELGADDYVVKPVPMARLLARVKAVLRRSSPPAEEGREKKVQVSGLHIDPASYTVTVDGTVVAFPRKEFQTLLYLARHNGSVVSREQLLSAVWGDDVVVVDRTIDVHIRKIREKLGRRAVYIETVKGVGYRFHADR